MNKQKLLFNYLLRKYNKYKAKLNRFQSSGRNLHRQGVLRKHIERLQEKLYELQASINLKKISKLVMLSASMILITPESKAQANFTAVVVNPFSLTDIGARSNPSFGDLDGDGDLDMLTGTSSGDFYYFENTGTSLAPSFGTAQLNPYSLSNITSASAPEFVDIDNDGDLDIFAGEFSGDFNYFENVGTVSSPSFAANINNPMSLTSTFYEAAPSFKDLDGDGDFDLMAGEAYGSFNYFENTGTTSVPNFAAVQQNSFSLVPFAGRIKPSLVDFDNDGDYDLMLGDSYGSFSYFENIGSTSIPSYGARQENPFSLSMITNGKSTTSLVDIDGDGDLDMFSGSDDGNFYFFENIAHIWTGTNDTDWATASNWKDNIIPTNADYVYIPDVSLVSGNFPVIAAATSIGNTDIASGASLTVNTGIVLSDTITNNGTLTLKDGAYLDNFTNASAAVVGSITVETTAANGISNDQRLISSAVSNPAFSEIADDLNGPWGVGAQGTNNVAITVDDCATPTLTSTSNYGNLFEFDESLVATCALDGWVVRSSGNLQNGKGYSAYLPTGSTFDFTGVPNSGNVTVAVTKGTSAVTDGEGWNLIGNPYPSPISRDAVVTAGGANASYFVTTGVYQGSYSAYMPSSNIAIGQGFQVEVAASGNIIFTDAMRNTNAATWYQNDNWFEHKLEVSVQGPSFADKTTLFFNNEASNGYEAMYDVSKRKSLAGHPSLSTFGAGKDLTLNGLSVNDLGETIPMNLDAGTNGSFTLSFEGKETFPANTTIYVKDLQENVLHNIADGDYTFTANTADNADRFEIVFIPEVKFATTNVDCELNNGGLVLENMNHVSNRTFEVLKNNTVIGSGNLADLSTVSLAAGNYTLNVADAFGGSQSYDITIETANAMEASLSISSTEIQVGEVISLNNTTSNANTVVWTINNETIAAVNNLSYSFEEAGVYEVVMSVSNDECSDIKTEMIKVVNKSTGINDVLNNNLTIHPNPIKDYLIIDFDGAITLEIVNTVGQKVLISTEKEVNTSALKSGIYFVYIYNDAKELLSVNKVIKK